MKDFDFDELDRAVSSALGGKTPNSPAVAIARPVDTPVATREEAVASPVGRPEMPAAPAPVEAVPERPEEPQIEREVAREVVAERPVVTRPAGPRYMDLVRQSPTAEVRSTPEPVAAIVQPVEVAPEVPARPRASVPMNDISPVPRTEVYAAAGAPVVPSVEEEIPWEPPVYSPFLVDAKVEKRPLGASGPTGLADIPSAFEEIPAPQPAVESPVEVAPVELTVEAPAPEELSVDEPTEDIGFAPMSDPAAEMVPEFGTVEEVSLPEPTLQVEPEVATPAPAPEELVASEPIAIAPASDISEYAAPVAITPQYQPKPSTTEESGEIFDTESYHQPIVAKKKKKGGALKLILVAVAVLLVGGGIGAGAYFYILPML